MTRHELKKIIDHLGLNQTEAARLLGIDGRSMRRYLAEDRRIPEPTAKLLRLLERRPELIGVLEEMEAKD